MRNAFALIISSTLLMALAMLATPAVATNARQAISMCDKRGNACSMRVDGEGNTTLCVTNPDGPHCVECPLHGQCTVIFRRGESGKGKFRSVGGILHPPSAGIKSSGASTPSKGHHPPVKISGFAPPSGIKTTGGRSTPVTIQRTEEHHSGGSHK